MQFIRTKESLYIRIEFYSQRIGLEHQHGRRDVMWKRFIRHWHISHDIPCIPSKFCVRIVFSYSWDNCKASCKWTQQLPTLAKQCCVCLYRAKSLTGFNWTLHNNTQTSSNNMQQGVQTDAICSIQQCWEFLANHVASVCAYLDNQEKLKSKGYTIFLGGVGGGANNVFSVRCANGDS